MHAVLPKDDGEREREKEKSQNCLALTVMSLLLYAT